MSQRKGVTSLTGQIIAIRTALKRELGHRVRPKIEPVRAVLREIAQDKPLVESSAADRLTACWPERPTMWR